MWKYSGHEKKKSCPVTLSCPVTSVTHDSLSRSLHEAIIITTCTENVASFCGVPYLEFIVPAAYVNRQKNAERKYSELRMQEKS